MAHNYFKLKYVLKIIWWPFKQMIAIISWLTGGWAKNLANRYKLMEKAENSRIRAWADSLTGWKYWTWNICVGIVIICVAEYLLNLLGQTMLPWRMF